MTTRPRSLLLRRFLTAALYAGLVGYVVYNWEEFRAVATVRWEWLVVVILVTLVHICITGKIFAVFVKALGTKLSFTEWLGVTVISAFANSFLPLRLGASIKAVYLKRRYGFLYSHFLSVFGVGTIVSLIGLALFSLLVLPVTAGLWGREDWQLGLATSVGMLIVAVGIAFIVSRTRISTRSRFTNILYLTQQGWLLIHRNRRCVAVALAMNLLSYVNSTFGLYFLFLAIDSPIPWVNCSLIVLVLSFLQYVSPLPNNLGIQEALGGVLGRALGAGFYEGMAVMLIGRLVNLLVLAVLTPLFQFLLFQGESWREWRQTADSMESDRG